MLQYHPKSLIVASCMGLTLVSNGPHTTPGLTLAHIPPMHFGLTLGSLCAVICGADPSDARLDAAATARQRRRGICRPVSTLAFASQRFCRDIASIHETRELMFSEARLWCACRESPLGNFMHQQFGEDARTHRHVDRGPTGSGSGGGSGGGGECGS